MKKRKAKKTKRKYQTKRNQYIIRYFQREREMLKNN